MSDRGWALVTGAGRRLGQALALGAAQAGFDVLIHVREAAAGADTAQAVTAAGQRAKVIAADLAEAGCAGAIVEAAPGPLRLLVNSASVFQDDSFETAQPGDLDEAVAVNLRAPVLLAQAFAGALAGADRGLIVNIIDQRVLRLDPRYFSYSISKAALWAATRMMAQALAPRIRVNAIGPGPTLPSIHQSEQGFAEEAAGTLLGEPVSPDQIVLALRYLIEATAVTGQLIAVDSGQNLAWRTPDVVGP